LKLFKAVGDKLGEANVRKAIGDVQKFRDERDQALESYHEALKLFKAVGSKLGEANVLAALSRMAVSAGNIEEAERQFLEIIQMRRAIRDLYSEGADTGNFAIALLNAGYKDKAKNYAIKAKDIFTTIQIPALVAMMEQVVKACENESINEVQKKNKKKK
jgi:tetratricopeptide (TPR) repeat protein